MKDPLHVLILEDDATKLQQVAEFLVGAGFTDKENLVSATDVLSAKRELERRTFDVLIIDLAVPRSLGERVDDAAGFELLDEVFEREGLRMPAQVVGLTGYTHLVSGYDGRFAGHGVLLVHFDIGTDAWKPPIAFTMRRARSAKAAIQSAPQSYETYLGIVCALDSPELDAVLRLPWKWDDKRIPSDPTIYYKGSFMQGPITRSVVATSSNQPGMAAAAITATKLIQNFRPNYLGMTGITAGIRGKVDLGDIVVADPCWDWGRGRWESSDRGRRFRPAPLQLALDAGLRNQLLVLSGEELVLARIRSEWVAQKPSTSLRLHVAPVASGAAVIADQSMTDEIAAQHRKLAAIEMEVFGIYAAAAEAALPKPVAFSLKGVSDFADHEKNDDWQWYAAEVSARTMQVFVESYLRS